MRILFVVEHFPSFSETFVLNQITGLMDLGHDVEIYAIGKPSGKVVHPDVFKYNLMGKMVPRVSIPKSRVIRLLRASVILPRVLMTCGWKGLISVNPKYLGRKALNLSFLFTCIPLLKLGQHYDVVHCHFGDKGLLAIYWGKMGLLGGAIITTTFHAHELSGLTVAEGRRAYLGLLESGSLLLPISDRWRQRLIQWGANPARVKVHHMGVDVDDFEYRQRRVSREHTVYILSVGRLVEQKGYEYAVRAVAQVRLRTGWKIEYTVIGAGDGAGDLLDSLTSLVDELGCYASIKFVGPKPQDVVRDSLACADAFLLPSVTTDDGFQEGIPVALMEAMASGVPVVSTNHSGIPELITDRKSGLLVEERNPQALADCIIELISDSHLASRLREEGRRVVESKFNLSIQNEKLEHHFENELRRHNAAS